LIDNGEIGKHSGWVMWFRHVFWRHIISCRI